MLTFYDAPISGNTYKVRLLLGQLAIPHEAVRLDIAGGAVRAKEFRKVNPFGRVPFIVEEGFALADRTRSCCTWREARSCCPPTFARRHWCSNGCSLSRTRSRRRSACRACGGNSEWSRILRCSSTTGRER